ncbi:MAG TPA: polyphosphate kinase 1 [Terriglobales bacterium]|nr:polyphosphate kinase 1 [Terriglobales bacterium]
MARPRFDRPSCYLNREASWLAFNRRVLQEAQDRRNPLLERVKFLAITASNLDEFFEVRLADLLQQVRDGEGEPGPDGLSPTQVRDRLIPALHRFVELQYQCWNRQLRPQLARQQVRTLALAELSESRRRYVAELCAREVDPLLTPITVDPAHPFPRVLNKAMCLAFLLQRRGARQRSLGVVTVPRALPRIIRLPGAEDEYVYLAHIVAAHADAMYRGYRIEAAAAFRLSRNSNLYLHEEESHSLLEAVRLEVHNRREGVAVRLEIEAGAHAQIVERLRTNFHLDPWQIFSVPGPVNLPRLIAIYDHTRRPDLKFPVYTAPLTQPAAPVEVFNRLRQRDRLFHHPYDSYNEIVQFLEAAAADPQVLSIKQTLYRTTEDSPIVHALISAAATKEVAVVVELKARFDEARNIAWARHLEDAGVQVFYGAVGRKTHCKMALVVRQDEDGVLRRYLHLGTGNYNHRTARLYTDFSLMTVRPEITAAAHSVFGYLTAGSEPTGHAPLLVAPLDLAARFTALIARETEHARRGRAARLIVKVNGLLDPHLIQALYAASAAGVEIDLLVRGMCALRPGYRDVSRNIRVRSLVGRFLEHSRIFYFLNGGAEEVYLGSADWMPRNLYERVEVVYPVLDAELRRRLRHEILAAYLADTAQTRWLSPSGAYRRSSRRGFSAQEFFMARSQGRATLEDIPAPQVHP